MQPAAWVIQMPQQPSCYWDTGGVPFCQQSVWSLPKLHKHASLLMKYMKALHLFTSLMSNSLAHVGKGWMHPPHTWPVDTPRSSGSHQHALKGLLPQRLLLLALTTAALLLVAAAALLLGVCGGGALLGSLLRRHT